MDTKQLTCVDEEFLIQITKLKDEIGDLIISFSFTRTYLFSNHPESHMEVENTPTQAIMNS